MQLKISVIFKHSTSKVILPRDLHEVVFRLILQVNVLADE